MGIQVEFNPEKIKIVKMQKKDLKDIFEMGKKQWLGKSWFGMDYIKNSFDQKGMEYVAKISNQVVGGIIMVREDIVKNWIRYLIVDKKYREKGIGSMLLEKIISHLKKGESIFVDTGVAYKSAVKFYEKQGFKNRGKVMSLYGNDQAYIFEKNIKMVKYKKGTINLLLFFLVSALFLFGIVILWSKNWLIDKNSGSPALFFTKSVLEKNVDERRNKRIENLNKSLEIYDDKK